MVDDTRDQAELDFGGKWIFCSILVFHVRDMLSPLFETNKRGG